MTKEERERLNKVCEEVAGLNKIIDNHTKAVELHTEKLSEINQKLNNGIIAQVEIIWKEVQNFHREKLEQMKKHQEYLEGGERREVPPVKIEQVPSTWSKMHWLQKVGIIGGVIVLLFRPEIQEIAKVIVSQFLGVEF